MNDTVEKHYSREEQNEMLKWAEAQGKHAEGAAEKQRQAEKLASEQSRAIGRGKAVVEAAQQASQDIAENGIDHDIYLDPVHNALDVARKNETKFVEHTQPTADGGITTIDVSGKV